VIRTLILAALLPLVSGQSPPVVATTATQPDGHVILTVQNLSESALTAYFYKRVGVGFVEMGYKDAAVNFAAHPVPPNQRITVTFPNGEVTFLAAIWADGTSFGDPAWVNRLRERRALGQQHNDNAIAVLQKALDSGTDTAALITQLQTIIDGITPLTLNQDDVFFVRGYYDAAMRRFANPGMKHLDGTPLTAQEIMRVDIEELNRRRERLRLYR
jgi:hypothetical protein